MSDRQIDGLIRAYTWAVRTLHGLAYAAALYALLILGRLA